MYTVLIIDDEEPVREAIRLLGDWRGLGVTGIREAADGRAGLAMLAEGGVDLAMIDMKMPVMDGAELLQAIERDYPELPAIVVSGYDDFAYARQAIRSHVVDYLLKPVSRSELNQALRKAIDLIEAKRRQESESVTRGITLNMSLPRLKEKVYESIIERSFVGRNEAFLPLIGADNPDNRFAAVVWRAMNFGHVCDSRFGGDKELLHFAMANVMDEIAGGLFGAFSFASAKRERELVSVLTIEGGGADFGYRLLHQVRKASAELRELLGLVTIAGIGPIRRDALELAASYEAAKAAIAAIDLAPLQGPVVREAGTDKPAALKDAHSLAGRMAIIRSALESGSVHNAQTVLSEFVRRAPGAAVFTIGEADHALRELVFRLNDVALELGAPAERLPMNGEAELDAFGVPADFASLAEFERLLHRLVEFFDGEIRRSQLAGRPFDAADIKQYIDQHYYEDIKISMFAEKYFLSREYLMKLFKQQFGCGIHEYVQQVRMGKAQELLANDELKVQDIAAMLGYKDKNYFSKAFRNYFGVSPSEYRAGESAGKR